MISPNDQTYILNTVKRLLPQILKEINFDPTVKEVGHTFGEKVEEVLVNKLVELDSRFTAPDNKREMQDVSFNDDLINIKFGFDKKGQPNMVAFNRLSTRYLKNEIDSYYIISIDGKTNKVTFFDLYQQLPYTNYNVGTGQVMLKEKQFFNIFNQQKDYSLSKLTIINTLRAMKVQSHNEHVTLKEQQLKKSLELFDTTLRQYS
jgi:predicted double-glycine peptidase|tara:strand:- start:587 stop:1198 length:612 start_codon:yes stop_codon:yes gene_type:complete